MMLEDCFDNLIGEVVGNVWGVRKHASLDGKKLLLVRPIDPITTTVLAWSAMHGLAMLWLDGAFRKRLDRPGIDALTERIAQLISQLLAPEPHS